MKINKSFRIKKCYLHYSTSLSLVTQVITTFALLKKWKIWSWFKFLVMKLETTAEHDSLLFVYQDCYRLFTTNFAVWPAISLKLLELLCNNLQFMQAKVCHNLGESRFRHAAENECVFGCEWKETPCPTVIYNLALPFFQESGW